MSDPWRCTRGSRSVIATWNCNSMCRRMKHFHIFTFILLSVTYLHILAYLNIRVSHTCTCALWLIYTFATLFTKDGIFPHPQSILHFAAWCLENFDFSKACNTVTDTAHSGNAHNCRFHGLYFWLLEFALPSSCSHCSIQGNTTHAVLQ